MNFLSTLHLFLLSDSNTSAAHDATRSQENLLDGSSVSYMWDTSKLLLNQVVPPQIGLDHIQDKILLIHHLCFHYH